MDKKTIVYNRKKTILIAWVLIMLAAVFLLNNYFNGKTEVKWKKYLIIGKENLFVVYDNKLSLKIPEDTYIGSNKKVSDYLEEKKYSELFQVIKSIFPEEIEGYVIPKGNIEVSTVSSVNIPTVKKLNRNYILTSALNEIFIKLYYGNISDDVNKNIIIDILNASGKAGYARKVGEKIETDIGFKYNPATNEEESQYSYIINNSLSPTQLEKLVESLNEKYIRIKEKSKLPTPANAVVIIGKESSDILDIKIYKNIEEDKENVKKLQESGYINLKSQITKEMIDESSITYRAEDYYIAYKISKILGINKLIEDKDMNDSINIYIR